MKRIHKFGLLWLAFFAWLGTLLFLSFQTGEGTAETSVRIAILTSRILSTLGLEVSYAMIHRMLRTVAHVVVFLVFGCLLEACVAETMRVIGKKNGSGGKTKGTESAIGKTRGLLTVMLICAGIAIISEVFKIYIPGRHLDWPEVGLNIVSAWIGCGGMYAVDRLCQIRKSA